jgi:hypothetical protein
MFQRFVKALHRALPGLPMPELFWRIHFAMGAMAHALRCGGQLADRGPMQGDRRRRRDSPSCLISRHRLCRPGSPR